MVRIQPDPPCFCGGCANCKSSEVPLQAAYLKCDWGISSAGRAPALQAGGRRFDPVILHQLQGNVLGKAVKYSLDKH